MAGAVTRPRWHDASRWGVPLAVAIAIAMAVGVSVALAAHRIEAGTAAAGRGPLPVPVHGAPPAAVSSLVTSASAAASH